jgi:hydrogenase maturation protein HypF
LASRDPAAGAALFHATLAEAILAWILAAGDRAAVRRVAIAGGCAMNEVLLALLRPRCAAAGIALLEARRAPPGDGGLSLGQAWVARRWLAELVEIN